MLVLAHADGLGINLHQLCQRVLETSCNGSGAALSHIKLGKFFRSQLAGRVHGGTGFIDNHILDLVRDLFQQVHNDLLRLPGGGTVSHGNQGNMVLADQFFQNRLCFLHLVLGGSGVDHRGIQHLAGIIHHSQLAAGAEGRVPAQDHTACNGGLHQKLL